MESRALTVLNRTHEVRGLIPLSSTEPAWILEILVIAEVGHS
jgi:hypothetical protein